MINNITFGQYIPGNSFFHKCDPRSKLIGVFWYVVLIFLCKSFFSLALVSAFTLISVIFSGVNLKTVLKSLKPVLIILIFTAIVNLFYTSGGEIIFAIRGFKITEKGVNTAVFTVLRIINLVVVSSLLTYTTTPTMLTDGIERLLHPLTYLHINVGSLAMMMTLALRFIPTLIEEIQRIINAQKSRGADFENGGIVSRAKALVPIFVPLIISSFRRAYELAFAMTARCYTGGNERTRMKQMKIKVRDIFVFVYCVVLTSGIIVLNRLFEAVL
ncbi:MAG: energy-coupling factor transporter transmembrane protein EcfT [Clostridiales bacterium]|nr:energy-coupling factor transporter transmembrane protein EcfT [Clostridiales bacterium]